MAEYDDIDLDQLFGTVAAAKEKPCRVCLVKMQASELDRTGRCSFCSEILQATNEHTTYGKMKGKAYEAQLKAERLKNPVPATSNPTENKERYLCKNCGGELNDGTETFCCRECRTEWERKVKKAKKNGPFPRDVERHCLQCGQIVTGKRKFCCDKCAYLYKHPDTKPREKKPDKLCIICGKKIEMGRKRKTCSIECEKELRNKSRASTLKSRKELEGDNHG